MNTKPRANPIDENRVSRRCLLALAPSAGAAVVIASPAIADPAPPASVADTGSWQPTDHVRRYYRSARF